MHTATSTHSKTYAVVGTGGIGGFYGGHLSRIGRDVRFLMRSDYAHVSECGLRVASPAGDFALPAKSIQVFNDVTKIGTVDVILVCLKTTSNNVLAHLLPPLLHENSLVVLIQNGYRVEEDVAKLFPDVQLAGGLAFICAQKNSPGLITHTDYGKITLAAYSPRAQEAVDYLAKDIRETSIEVVIAPDLTEARWRKLVWNVPFNGLSVIMDSQTTDLVEDEDKRKLVEKLMKEVVLAAKAVDECDIPCDFVTAMVNATRQMLPYSPSMKLDFDSGRLLEVESIYGNLVRAARAAGCELPHIETLYQQLLCIASQRCSR
eukprot:CFRG7238T1